MSERLSQILNDRGVNESLISDAIESGYFIRDWIDPLIGEPYISVSDRMYGSKQFSSSFGLEDFAQYLLGERVLEPLPPFAELTVRNRSELVAVLADSRRQRLVAGGLLSFRGQPREYHLIRKVPNPRRRDGGGRELSILPGLYRQSDSPYSFARPLQKHEPWAPLLQEIEPNAEDATLDGAFARDMMRTEQHYATQTSGLDVSFSIEIALFFATHEFVWREGKGATYRQIKRGGHQGVIYCFRFRNPSVTETECLIRDFDFFVTNRPERILRQRCGLPLIGEYERNIAITDIDCIVRLAPDFLDEAPLSPRRLFPAASEDAFYRVLLNLKERFPAELSTVVEYEWAREEQSAPHREA